jgi:hypothetical protein
LSAPFLCGSAFLDKASVRPFFSVFGGKTFFSVASSVSCDGECLVSNDMICGDNFAAEKVLTNEDSLFNENN